MGAPSPCPVIPPRVNAVYSTSRYWLDDMVVVQVCRRLMRTILVAIVVFAGGGLGGALGVRQSAGRGNRGGGSQKVAAVHLSLLAATSRLVQYGSLRSSMRTIGVRWVVALINFPSPM